MNDFTIVSNKERLEVKRTEETMDGTWLGTSPRDTMYEGYRCVLRN